jgi:hypothetical protein
MRARHRRLEAQAAAARARVAVLAACVPSACSRRAHGHGASRGAAAAALLLISAPAPSTPGSSAALRAAAGSPPALRSDDAGGCRRAKRRLRAAQHASSAGAAELTFWRAAAAGGWLGPRRHLHRARSTQTQRRRRSCLVLREGAGHGGAADAPRRGAQARSASIAPECCTSRAKRRQLHGARRSNATAASERGTERSEPRGASKARQRRGTRPRISQHAAQADAARQSFAVPASREGHDASLETAPQPLSASKFAALSSLASASFRVCSRRSALLSRSAVHAGMTPSCAPGAGALNPAAAVADRQLGAHGRASPEGSCELAPAEVSSYVAESVVNGCRSVPGSGPRRQSACRLISRGIRSEAACR